MKKLLFIVLLLNAVVALGQPFAFTDSTFKKGQFLPLWDIYFEMGSGHLMDGPQLQLDSLTQFLLRHPGLKVELGVHMDFRGDDDVNLWISTQRAISLKKHLTDKGVKSDHIVAIGFGENKPVLEYEDWKKLMDTHRCGYYGKTNRRVTVVIL